MMSTIALFQILKTLECFETKFYSLILLTWLTSEKAIIPDPVARHSTSLCSYEIDLFRINNLVQTRQYSHERGCR